MQQASNHRPGIFADTHPRQLDSPFQLQEHLKALYNNYTKPEDSGTIVPINRDVAVQLAEPPEGIDRSLWLYELCRFLTMKVNNLVVAFFAEDPPCSSHTCPEMRASEWQYLCAVHDPPKCCCAIDYSCHTLDWATNILTSPKYFPSRLTLGSSAHGGPQASMRHLTNIFRRLYRIFAHAWFQHRDVFWQVEGNDGLYIFFKTVCDLYNLIPEDNYTVPPEAEGQEAQQPGEKEKEGDGQRVMLLRKEDDNLGRTFEEPDAPGATTRRHKHTPSTGSRVTTIAEGTEEEDNRKHLLPEVQEEAGKKQSEESPAVKDAEEEQASEDVSATPRETGGGQEEKAPEPTEPQPIELQSTEPQESEPQQLESQSPEAEQSASREPQTPEEKSSEAPVAEPQPPEPEEPSTEEQNPAQPTEIKIEAIEIDESKETQGQEESEAEKTVTEDTSTKTPELEPEPEPEPKPTESEEAPKET